ncbi:hypothetical protein [Parvibaculum sp.]|uniref:hypothetical protein n=1 Tax=Parvibaculum sp. TaxID=2024848 RepID=UPI002BBC45CD|nr:hypothetical protein [Parvibaculum sp.]HUD50856.1 hypothetical protein [Parvibaculum sp.]
MIKIGASQPLDESATISLDSIKSIDELFACAITDVTVKGTAVLVKVDSFPFLHALIASIYLFERDDELFLPVGEGLDIRARRSSSSADSFDLVLSYGGDVQCTRTTSQLLLLLINLAADQGRSLSAVGVDVDRSLEKFPVALF